MSERNSQTPSTRQAPFGTRLKKALRLSSVLCVYSSPRTGTVSYEEQTVTDVTSVEVQTVVQACWSMLGSICLKSCDNVVTCPIIGACVRTFLFNKAVYRKSSRIRFFYLEQCLCWCDLHQVSPSGWIMCCLSGRKTCRKV